MEEETWLRPNQELLDRIKLTRKMKQNMGRTALMLSGGGAQVRLRLQSYEGIQKRVIL